MSKFEVGRALVTHVFNCDCGLYEDECSSDPAKVRAFKKSCLAHRNTCGSTCYFIREVSTRHRKKKNTE